MLYTFLDTTNPFATAAQPVIELLNLALAPALGIVSAVGVIYCILLGTKLAKAEEPQDREKAKNALKNALVGFVLIFVMIVVLKVGMGAMSSWMSSTISSADTNINVDINSKSGNGNSQ